MGFMGTTKGQLENNSSITAFRVRCAEIDCNQQKEFPPQSMTLVQKGLTDAGWLYTPGPDNGEGPELGVWRCPDCGAAKQLTAEEVTSEVTSEGDGEGDEGGGEKKEEDLTTE